MQPIAFGFGTAIVAMVGTNWGARQYHRARQIAWTGATTIAAVCGTIGLNKAGVLVFRALLRDAVPHLLETRLLNFNSFAPDLVFGVGDSEEGLNRMLRAAGMDEPRPRRGFLAWLGRAS